MAHDNYSFEKCGVPMTEVLTPRECEEVRIFLRALVTYYKKYSVKVSPFLSAWSKYTGGHKRRPRKMG